MRVIIKYFLGILAITSILAIVGLDAVQIFRDINNQTANSLTSYNRVITPAYILRKAIVETLSIIGYVFGLVAFIRVERLARVLKKQGTISENKK